jgi:hypothetical protein
MTSESMIVVIGVDPGESTGVAELVDGKLVHIFQGTGEGAMDVLDSLLRLHSGRTDRKVAVACERFVSGNQVRSHQPEAQQIVGNVLRAGHHHGVEVDLQAPSDAHAIGQNFLLQKLDLWPLPSQVGCKDADDVRMAVRHALLYLARHHASVFEGMVKGAPID